MAAAMEASHEAISMNPQGLLATTINKCSTVAETKVDPQDSTIHQGYQQPLGGKLTVCLFDLKRATGAFLQE